MSEMFKINHNDIYQLRSNDRKLYLGKPKTDFMKNSFSFRGAFAWNDLPNNVVNGYNELSTRSFKTLINNPFDALGRCWQHCCGKLITLFDSFRTLCM